MVRLGLVILLATGAIHYALSTRVDNPYVMALASVLLSAVMLIGIYAQIRLVVEDRRSALGAVLGAIRFVRRNGAALGLYLVFAALLWAATRTFAALAPSEPEWRGALAMTVVHHAVIAFLGLALYAAGISLFQSRLAHASYTAAPPIAWPDSPAAEAITNRIPEDTP